MVSAPPVKDLTTSYALALIGFFFPFASGLHHFYLNKPLLGLAYLFTAGFCWIGTVIDLIRMPSLVEDENLKLQLRAGMMQQALAASSAPPPPMKPARLPRPKPTKKVSDEQKLLMVANQNDGALTVALASIETGIPLDACKRLLEKMVKNGYCRRDVSAEADDLYVFPGLRSNKPFEV